MKAQAPLTRVRSLTLRAARPIGIRRVGAVPLVWRSRRHRERPGGILLRPSNTFVTQTFPISIALTWPVPAKTPRSTMRVERHIVSRETLIPGRTPGAVGQRHITYLTRLVQRLRKLTRGEIAGPPLDRAADEAVRQPALDRPANREADASAIRTIAGVAPGFVLNRNAAAAAARDSAVAPPSHRDGIPASTPAPWKRFDLGWTNVAERRRSMRMSPAAPPARSRTSPRTPLERLILRRDAAGASSSVHRPHRPRPSPPQPSTSRTRVELVWASAASVAAAEVSAPASALPFRPSNAPQPQARQAGPSAAFVSAAAQRPEAAAPDMNRLVDEVVRRLDRIARDERMRRGI